MMPLYINYPSFIHPQIFPGVPVLGLLRWYGLMYIFAFATAFVVLRREMNEGVLNDENYQATEDDIISFIATGIIFLLIGAIKHTPDCKLCVARTIRHRQLF